MVFIEILIFAVGLSLDVFAYALCKGAVMPEIKRKNMLKLCSIFTAWQTMSLILGNLITNIPIVSASSNEAASNWKVVSVVIFLCLGICMIMKSALNNEQIVERKEEYISTRQIIIWACITSIDAFLAGIGFGFFQVDFLLTVMANIVITILAVIGGVYMGYWMGCQIRGKAVALGGCMILIGGIELILRTVR